MRYTSKNGMKIISKISFCLLQGLYKFLYVIKNLKFPFLLMEADKSVFRPSIATKILSSYTSFIVQRYNKTHVHI